MLIKPKCRVCQRIYLGGEEGCCDACRSGGAGRRKPRRLRCQCGRLAVSILLAEVIDGDGEPLQVEIPLCPACEKEELRLEASLRRAPPAAASPVQVIHVQSLPHAHAHLRGSKIG